MNIHDHKTLCCRLVRCHLYKIVFRMLIWRSYQLFFNIDYQM